MKILLTGFDPFGGEPINPAIESVKRVKDEINGATIIKLEIPTVYRKSIEAIDQAIQEHQPDVVLSIGQAGGRFNLTPERVGINIDDFRIPDNEGNQPVDQKIFEDGEPAYFSNLPIKAMVKNMIDNGIPAAVSNTAGTFVCNHVLYGNLYLIATKYPNIKGGFMHIPYMTEQVLDKANTPAMSLDEIVKGIEYAIEAITMNDTDISITGGTIC